MPAFYGGVHDDVAIDKFGLDVVAQPLPERPATLGFIGQDRLCSFDNEFGIGCLQKVVNAAVDHIDLNCGGYLFCTMKIR